MAYGIVHFFAGGTRDQYEATLAVVHPDRKTLPTGQLYHVAGPSAGGWTVIAIHDSKASWERFRDDILLPRLKQGVKGGFVTAPQEQAFEVYMTVEPRPRLDYFSPGGAQPSARPPEEVARAHKSLWRVERAFRETKATLGAPDLPSSR